MNARKLIFSGYLLDGRTAGKLSVEIHLKPRELTLTIPNGQTLIWSYKKIQIQRPEGVELLPVHLDHSIQEKAGLRLETLVVNDPAFLASLQAMGPAAPGSEWEQTRRNKMLGWIAGVLAVPLILYALWVFAIPKIIDGVANRVSVAWEEELGEKIFKGFFFNATEKTDARQKENLEFIIQRLLSAVPNQPYRIRVTIHPSEMVNAMALPGGNIIVFQGLVNASGSAEELAGVLAHELQHVLLRHSTRGIIRSMASNMLMTLISGNQNDVMSTVLGLAGGLESLAFSRRMEEEADLQGIKMMLAAKVDPKGMVEVFRKLKKEEEKMYEVIKKEKWRKKSKKWMDYLSTHPSGKDRVAMMRSVIMNSPPMTPIALLPGSDWRATMHKKKPSDGETDPSE
jgi:Zn-dependent protease with chaperone function